MKSKEARKYIFSCLDDIAHVCSAAPATLYLTALQRKFNIKCFRGCRPLGLYQRKYSYSSMNSTEHTHITGKEKSTSKLNFLSVKG